MMIGDLIKIERQNKKLTQAGLASKAGCSWMTIWRIENSITKNFSVELLERIARGLGMKPETLVKKIHKDGRA